MKALSWSRKCALQALSDVVSWSLAMPLAVALRYDSSPTVGLVPVALLFGLVCGLVFLLVGTAFHLHRDRYVVGPFDEVLGVVVTALAVGAGAFTLGLFLNSALPRTAPVIGTGIAIGLMLADRFLWINTRHQSALARPGSRTLIYRAGDARQQIANLMLADPTNQFQPERFTDDDPTKRHLRPSGLRVLGCQEDIEKLIRFEGVQTLLVAIAGITSARLLELDRRCMPMGVAVRVIPTASEIVGGAVRLGDISEVTEEDFLGRRPIETDEVGVTDFIRGNRVLVTGAGGSIGSELVRQLARYNPSDLLLVDRDESTLHAVQLTLDGSGTPTSESLHLADLRDEDRITSLFQQVSPDIVLHAAALKHLALLKRFPDDAYKTNVLGTRSVLAAAAGAPAGVNAFVNISEEKAVDPNSALGYRQPITEWPTVRLTLPGSGKFVTIRSRKVPVLRGSVIYNFHYQIAKGGPVMATDERVTRYFMTASEAAPLVFQAAVMGDRGETLILDMGTPVKNADVARYMIQRSGRDTSLKFTGPRSGEKLGETLVAEGATATRPRHPLLSHARALPPSIGSVAGKETQPLALSELIDLAPIPYVGF